MDARSRRNFRRTPGMTTRFPAGPGASNAGSGDPHPARLHEPDELPEQVVAVVGARARLRVVLDRDHGQVAVAEALDRAVVQVDVGLDELGLLEERGVD